MSREGGAAANASWRDGPAAEEPPRRRILGVQRVLELDATGGRGSVERLGFRRMVDIGGGAVGAGKTAFAAMGIGEYEYSTQLLVLSVSSTVTNVGGRR